MPNPLQLQRVIYPAGSLGVVGVANPLVSWEASDGVTGGIGSPVSAWVSGSYTLAQGTAGNRPTHTATFTAGHGVSFDGTNDVLSVANPFTETIGSLVMVFRTGTIGAKQVLCAVTNSAVANEWFEVGITTEGRLYIERNAAGTISRVVGSSILTGATSYQMLLTTDGGDYYLTVNGIEENPLVVESVGSYGWFGDVASADTFSVGAAIISSGATRFFTGILGLVRVYATDITH